MPQVMRACRPEHDPSDEWGQDCPVQWGGGGVVMSAKGGYRTAFFEAFPKTGSGFIRGEGATVPEAEKAALRKRRREMACPAHVLGRRGYTNGVGFCLRCGAYFSRAFSPVTRLGMARKPPSPFVISLALEGEAVPVSREDALRLARFGLRCPDPTGDESGYAEAMRAAAEAWALTGWPERLFEAIGAWSTPGVLASLFGDMELRGLRVAVSEVRAAAAVNAAAEV